MVVLVFAVAGLSFILGMVFSSTLGTGSSSQAESSVPQQTNSDDDIVLTQGLFRRIVQQSQPGVVNIYSTKYVKRSWFEDFFKNVPKEFRFFFGPPDEEREPEEQPSQSLGSGMIIDRSGIILTNYHVIEGAEEIKVRLFNNQSYDAKVIGTDDLTDIALLKIITDEKLHALPLGNSDTVRTGDWVVAIGNPFGFRNSVTVGVVSAVGGIQQMVGGYVDYIQTDAPINPGNSGGPLLNLKGEVIGINNWIFTRTYAWNGLGFAIPINYAKRIIPQLREHGKVERGYLGVTIQTGEDARSVLESLGADYGAAISEVEPNSPADNAGLKRYDVILEVNGKKVKRPEDLPHMIGAYPPGSKVTLTILRDGKKLKKTVKLTRRPSEKELRARRQGAKKKLGLTLRELTQEEAQHMNLPREGGLYVVRVDPRSPAFEAGIRRGDVILEVERKPVTTVSGLAKEIEKARKKGKKKVLLFIWRNGVGFMKPLDIQEK